MPKWFARLVLFLSGWKIDTQIRQVNHRCVILGVPHTSNFDFLIAMAVFRTLEIPVRFTIKKEWMIFPFRGWLKKLGAIPIDRTPLAPGSPRRGYVESMVALLSADPRLVILITPEGTRARRTEWKTGFYHVASSAGVPIGLGYLDYKNKIGGVGGWIMPSGNMDSDMRKVMDFYRDAHPRYPERFSLDLRYS